MSSPARSVRDDRVPFLQLNFSSVFLSESLHRGLMKPFVWYPWTKTTTWNATTVRWVETSLDLLREKNENKHVLSDTESEKL